MNYLITSATDAITAASELLEDGPITTRLPVVWHDDADGFRVKVDDGDYWTVFVEAHRHDELAVVTLETPSTVVSRSQVTCQSTDPRISGSVIAAIVRSYADLAELLNEEVTA